MRFAMISGGFDPLHPGHLSLIEHASHYGRVLVALNSDDWLVRKKGFVFQPWPARAAILRALRDVDKVVAVDDSDGTVCEAIRRLSPAVFCNGGDRNLSNTPEVKVCHELKIGLAWNVGGGKEGSSTEIAGREVVRRKWGTYKTIYENAWAKVKLLSVDPFTKHTPQRHLMRDEFWFLPGGKVRRHARRDVHVIENPGSEPLEIIEVQVGDCREDDVERLP